MDKEKYNIWIAWAEDPTQQEKLTKFGNELKEKYGSSEAIAGRGEGWWGYKGTENSISTEELKKLIDSGEIKIESVLRIVSRREGGELPSMFDSVIKVAEKIQE